MTNVSDFDYFLPEELIAQEPIEPRDSSRLLVLDKKSGRITHDRFFNIGCLLKPHDVLVINDTKVLPARLYAQKSTGAVIELLLLTQQGLKTWQALIRPGRKAPVGTKLYFPGNKLQATVIDIAEEGTRIIEFAYEGDFFTILEQLGQMPLPPYIKKSLDDKDRYQTVYAREKGSAAAPTAGLHFTLSLLERLEEQGITIARIMLHVGLGTFRPVKVKKVEDHVMHKEFYRLSQRDAAKINAARAAGGRVIAVGTTSVRTLETVAQPNQPLAAQEGWTQQYIYPGYQFKIVDGMITNFHLPKSTLLMLVSALAGRENILHAYEEAIKEKYRFFSFGDAMLIV
ncbi:MAG: tRNA preQ1(34) S-adenosylmethionine ribosyltransferase-isomerase QueA [Bacillota bacterium]|jgi:S-adenosylmethionine:tRNA ribosyltransferase-isomerase